MHKVIIAGSEGFIGNHLVRHLTSAGYQVYGCDLFETAMRGDYRYFKVTRLSPEWEEIFLENQFDYCINAAGSANVSYSMSHPVSDFEANALDTIRILDAIRRLNQRCRYIHISSAAVYGNPSTLPIVESAALRPLSPYGFHKLIAEEICKEYHQVFGISTAIIRPFSVYGNGLRKQLLWDVCNKLKNSDHIKLFGTGNESRDFLHINDFTLIIQKVLESATFTANVYNAASGVESTLKMVADLVESYFQGSKKISFTGEERRGDPINWHADISCVRNLGFSPKVTLEKGLPQYVRWFQTL